MQRFFRAWGRMRDSWSLWTGERRHAIGHFWLGCVSGFGFGDDDQKSNLQEELGRQPRQIGTA